MYRVLTKRRWMPDGVAEAWAHYIGSIVLDRVYEKRGETLWPEPYDYRADGTLRLRKEIAEKDGSPSGAWLKLGEIIGISSFPRLFRAWEQLKTDESHPDFALGDVLFSLDAEHATELRKVWARIGPILVQQ